MNFLKKIGLEPFIIMLFGSILLAYIYPPIGIEREGGVSLGEIANWGIFPRNATVHGVVVGGDGVDSARKYAGGDF